ncbi:hypothetical protein KP509_25G028600 [Ceratopteris richardii]|uniref:Uncharacterized protein n=1 Tax=Ceratopteris richardii TaxID=49495 RepID=A0A8T2RQT1_CERRI|nr:hypothetical protein KP509_25G028600 [Ceratopteris richardii]
MVISCMNDLEGIHVFKPLFDYYGVITAPIFVWWVGLKFSNELKLSLTLILVAFLWVGWGEGSFQLRKETNWTCYYTRFTRLDEDMSKCLGTLSGEIICSRLSGYTVAWSTL